jgi:MoaA/NifB/PqqE/SkfB family radical SAM enzyme
VNSQFVSVSSPARRDVTVTTIAEPTTPQFLWLDLTRKCQLSCVHCYNASGPDGTHGTMTREDWVNVLGKAADSGVFIASS